MTEQARTVPSVFFQRLVIGGVVLCVVAVVSAVACWWVLPTSQQLLDRGVELARQDPAASERYIRRAIRFQFGSFPDAEILLCRLLVRRNAWQEAESRLDAIDMTKCRPDLLLSLGREAQPTKLRQRGLAALQVASTSSGPEAVVALEALLADYKEWGPREQAIVVARQLTKQQPGTPKYWGSLIEHLTSLGRERECLEATREALKQQLPVEFRRELQHSIVQQLVNMGDAPAARRELTELRNSEPDTIRIRGMEVYLLRLEGRLEPALELATSIVIDAPNLVYARFTRGVVYLDLRRFDDAAKDLERTIEVQPFNAPARFKLSEAYRGLGRDDQAAENRRITAEIVERQKRIGALMKSRDEGHHDEQLYKELEQLHRDLGDTDSAKVWSRWVRRMNAT